MNKLVNKIKTFFKKKENALIEIKKKNPAQIELLKKVYTIDEAINVHCEPLEIKTEHFYSNGVYARQITIPAGVLLTGKLHRESHLNVMSKGKMNLLTEDGVKTLVAPFICESDTWTRKAAFCLEETVWTTFHKAEEFDIKKIEKRVIYEPSIEEIEELKRFKLEGK
jgi:hypothetical protein